MSCSLCKLYMGREIRTRLHHEDRLCIAVDCERCGVPMIVLKRHTSAPSDYELRHLQSIASSIFPQWRFRGPRSIPDHFHLHAEGRGEDG